MIFIPHSKHTYGPLRPVNRDNFTFYVDDVHISQETHLLASTACYRASFTIIYVDDFHTSQETHLSASTACYGDSFTFYVDDVRNSQETRLWASTACYFFFYQNYVRTSQDE
jgi:hypothetical protein